MKKSLIALAALAACGSSAGWSRRDDSEPRGHGLRALNAGGLSAERDELAGLSDTERAALEETTDDEASLRAIVDKKVPATDDAADDAGGDDDGADEDDDEAEEGAADQKGKVEPTADAAATAAAAAAADAKDKPGDGAAKPAATETDPAGLRQEQEPVVYTIAAPEDADAQITALRTEKAAAFKQLMDGELTPEQYSAKEDEVQGKISSIERQVTAASVAADISVQNAQRSYLGKVNALLDAAKGEGVDYRANPELHADLDRTVKFLANDPSNADKPEQWFLTKAHSMVKAMHGLGAAKAADDGKGAANDKPAAKGGKAPDLSGVPPTVRNVPAAATSDDGGEFAHLNNLTGMALERAVARMTPEQQQRWAEA